MVDKDSDTEALVEVGQPLLQAEDGTLTVGDIELITKRRAAISP